MKFFPQKKIITFVSLLVMVFSSPISANNQQKSPFSLPDGYLEQLDKKIDNLYKSLEKEQDNNRKANIYRDIEYFSRAYYHPLVRLELIRKDYPEYAAEIEKTMSKSEKEQLMEMQKIFARKLQSSEYVNIDTAKSVATSLDFNNETMCQAAKQECDYNRKDELNCRYVLDRCKGIVTDSYYEKIFAIYGKDVIDR